MDIYLQAKTKDLPSESHSVQNISDPIGQNTSQVKQNCCSKVFWTLAFQAFFWSSWRLQSKLQPLRIPRMPKDTSAFSHMQKKMHKWPKLILVLKTFLQIEKVRLNFGSTTNICCSMYCSWPLRLHPSIRASQIILLIFCLAFCVFLFRYFIRL